MSVANYSTLLTENNNSNLRILANQITLQTWGTRKVQPNASIDTNLSILSNVTVMTLRGANVGIGSTAPAQTLDVTGNIQFSGNLMKNNTVLGFDWTKTGNTLYVPKGTTIGIGTTNTQTSDLFVNGLLTTSNISVTGNFFIANDNAAVRNSLQVAPVKASFRVRSSEQSNFSLVQQGVFQATPQQADVYLNGLKLAYSNEQVRDYNLTWGYSNATHTIYTINLVSPAGYDDIVDISVSPSFLTTNATQLPGYVYQVITNNLWASNSTNTFMTQVGNLGIGTINPVRKLHVVSPNNNLALLTTDTNTVGQISGVEFGIPAASQGRSKIFATTKTGDKCDMTFSVQSGTNTSVNAMYINENGNVGIGTNNPTRTLHVNAGNIYTVNGSNSVQLGQCEVSGSTTTVIQGFKTGLAAYDGVRMQVGFGTGNYNNVALTYYNGINNTWSYVGLGIEGHQSSLVIESGGNLTNMTTIVNGSQFLRMRTNNTDRMVIDVNGNVGINTTSTGSYRMYLQGSLYASGDITALSDARFKDNLIPFNNALEKVNSITGYTYTRKDYSDLKEPKNTIHVGLIAQEVNEVIPEVVRYDPITDKYGIKYDNMAAVFTEAIKELTTKIDQLQTRVRILETTHGAST